MIDDVDAVANGALDRSGARAWKEMRLSHSCAVVAAAATSSLSEGISARTVETTSSPEMLIFTLSTPSRQQSRAALRTMTSTLRFSDAAEECEVALRQVCSRCSSGEISPRSWLRKGRWQRPSSSPGISVMPDPSIVSAACSAAICPSRRATFAIRLPTTRTSPGNRSSVEPSHTWTFLKRVASVH